MPKPVLFLDDGGVLNDNRLRGPEWERLVGDFLPDRLGGTAAAWTAVNRPVFQQIWPSLKARLPTFTSYRAFQRAYALEWMTAMCAAVGVPAPGDDEAVAINDALSVFVAERAVCAYPGAADAVQALANAGYVIHMASGTTSWELAAILGRMGIADCVTTLYGPDLVDTVKYGPAYYQAIFNDAGIDPRDALVIESDEECRGWAVETGAQAIWIDRAGDAPTMAAVADRLLGTGN